MVHARETNETAKCYFSPSLLFSLSLHRRAHILEIRRLFLGQVSSSRKATTSGVGVGSLSVKEASVEDAVVTTNSSTSEKKDERTRVVRL